MDSRMIDVAIGLVLVFAISSMLVTALQELWTSFFGLRAEFMRKAIASMLGDDKDLASALMKEPLLKSLALTDTNREPRPSYVSADMFVTALLSHMSTQYAGGLRPATPMDLLNRAESAMNPELVKSMKALVPGAENDWPLYQQRLRAWFDAVGERSIGWFKRNNQRSLFLFGLGLAFTININPIVIATALWGDAALRKSVVEQAELALKVYESEKAQSPRTGEASKPSAPAGAPAPSTVADSPAVRQVEAQLAYISEVLAAQSEGLRDAKKPLKNAEQLLVAQEATAEIEQSLDDERNAGKRGAREASHALERTNSALDRLRQAARALPGAASNAPAASAAGAPRVVGVAEVDRLAALLAIERERRNRPLDSAALRAEACNAQDTASQRLCKALAGLDELNRKGLPLGWQSSAWPKKFTPPAAACPLAVQAGSAVPALPTPQSNASAASAAARPGTPETSHAPAEDDMCLALGTKEGWGNVFVAVAGWLVVAFASTLGAPFWFDTLGKLVKLRGSGPRQEGGDAGAGGGPPKAPDRVDATAPTPAPAPGPTPPSAPAAASSDAMSAAEIVLTEAEILSLQRQLEMSAKDWSGRLDLNTRDAIRRWQTRRGERADGILTAAQIAALGAQAGGAADDGFQG